MVEFAIPTRISTYNQAVGVLSDYIRRNNIKSILLGLSGGADSVLSMHLLAEASQRLKDCKIVATHVNFHLRGDESNRDERFVKRLQQLYPTIPFLYKDFDTEPYAHQRKISIEMAARELRHDWWRKLKKELDIEYIATGHNANDNEETLMLNLLRGSSPAGLRGMKVLDNNIFRPLLGLYRDDILRLLNDFYKSHSGSQQESSHPNLATFDDLLHDYSDGFVTDSSNLRSDFRRNFLRHKVLPLLETQWEGIHSAMMTTMELQNEYNNIAESNMAQLIKEESKINPGAIRWSTLRECPAPMTLIYFFAKELGITTTQAREIAFHIPKDENGLCATPGRIWKLQDGAELITTSRQLILRKRNSCHYLTNPPENIICEKIELGKEEMKHIRKASLMEVYLPDSPENYVWRSPLPGDRIRLFPSAPTVNHQSGCRQSKLLSDVLKEAGVVISDRKKIILLANKLSDEIIWIPGIRRSGADLITKEHSHAYHLQFAVSEIQS